MKISWLLWVIAAYCVQIIGDILIKKGYPWQWAFFYAASTPFWVKVISDKQLSAIGITSSLIGNILLLAAARVFSWGDYDTNSMAWNSYRANIFVDISVKTLTIFILLFGEVIGIYGEIATARYGISWTTCGLGVARQLLLILGYAVGIKCMSVWSVGALSLSLIVVTEPFITWSVYRAFPSFGAGLGMAFGILGLMSTLLIK